MKKKEMTFTIQIYLQSKYSKKFKDGQIFELVRLRGDKGNYLLMSKWIHNSLSYKDSETV